MPSRAQRKTQKKAASIRRFLERHSTKQASPAKPVAPPEPKILAEFIGKLTDFGIEQRTVDYLYKAGVRFVRDLPTWGRENLRRVYGMKSRLGQVEEVLQSFGVTLPA